MHFFFFPLALRVCFLLVIETVILDGVVNSRVRKKIKLTVENFYAQDLN